MSIAFLGDIHIGYKRKSFTTKEGSERYSKVLASGAKYGLDKAECYADAVFQLGDLFDKFRNSDLDMARGNTLMTKFHHTIRGNHDMSNTYADISTFDLCSGGDRHTYRKFVLDGVTVFLVNHQNTQEKFTELLNTMYEEGRCSLTKRNILCLHTNYNLGYELTDTTNNIDSDQVGSLLEVFDFIISGHEHNYSSHHAGRFIMAGSVFPLATSELEDKYIHVYDPVDNVMTKHIIWAAGSHSVEFDVGNLPDELSTGTQFVTITGEATATQVAEVFKTTAKWWRECPTLLVCKPQYDVKSGSKEVKKLVKEDMVTNIRSLLKEDAAELFDSLVKELGEGNE